MPLADDAEPLTTVDDHALLNEFKMAAQSLIEVWSEGTAVATFAEMQRLIDSGEVSILRTPLNSNAGETGGYPE